MKWALALALGLAALLVGPSNALAAACPAAFTNAINTAGNGDVVQAPAGTCQMSLTTTNANTFTIQGDPSGSTLEPATANSPILKDNAGPHFTITGITFTGMNGAAALSTSGGDITLTGDAFTDNVGGAAEFSSANSVTIRGSTFSGNSGTSDGAVFIGSNPAITISGNTFSGNRAGRSGGALSISNGAQPQGGSAPVAKIGRASCRERV